MLGIKKLDLFVVKNFCLLFSGTFFICLFVFMMQFLWRYVDELIGKGLSIDILAKFFYYSGLTLIPMSLPLAILLASLISFGNMGERLELLAIRAAGISLIKVLRPLIIIVVVLAGTSFYFQNYVGPYAFTKLYTLIWSMKQTSPELDIPEGAFYDEIKGYNVYVKKKNKETGTLHDVMIYSFAEGFENARIILADSGKLDMSADKQHLVLNLYSGEQFENLQAMRTGAINVPYRRETFLHKQTIIDFDGGFQMQDANFLSSNSSTKDMDKIKSSIDSMNVSLDSVGRQFYNDAQMTLLQLPHPNAPQNAREELLSAQKGQKQVAHTGKVLPFDTLIARRNPEQRAMLVRGAIGKVQSARQDIEFKSYLIKNGEKEVAKHWAEWHRKFSLSLACLVFFFIGAPLGAIIRKGGLGLPVIISVLIFIVYYIIDNTSYRAARNLEIPVWFGMWLSTAILAPIGVFLTYKSNNDSMVFNIDAYRNFFRKLLGLRIKRTLTMKEVIIETPDYDALVEQLAILNKVCKEYVQKSRLLQPPNYLRIFWRNTPDEDVLHISEQLEQIVEQLSNSRNPIIIGELNKLPILLVHAHTSPFGVRWKNALAGVILPFGVILYFRIWRFRFRLLRDVRQIVKSSQIIQDQIIKLKTKIA